MKKRITLLLVAALLVVGGVWGNLLKTPVNLSMGWKVDGSADVTYNSGNKTITWVEGTTGTGLGQNDLYYNVADYDRLVIKVASSTCDNVRFRMDDDNAGGAWGCSYVDISASDEARTFTIDLPATYNEGESRTYSVIKRMWFNTLNVGNIVIDEIYFEKNYGGATAVKFNLDLSGFTGGWGANKVAATTTTLTKTTGENDGWELSGLSYDVSFYDRFVVKVNSSTLSDLHVRIANGDNFKTQNIGTVGSEKTFTIDLSGSSFTADNSTAVSTITRIWFASESSEVTGSATFSAIYLEKDLAVEDALTRSNTTANKYGTICLPFAASKPSNATIYDVVGYTVDGSDNPETLYLESVDALTAGKAYVFKSNDDDDITFNKTGTEDNLTTPVSGNSLVGVFNSSATVDGSSYLLSNGTWYKGGSSNTVENYRAYLTLIPAKKLTTPPTSRCVAMSFYGDETTGIETAQATQSSDAIYTLSGVQVKQPTRGIYVKNGKKYVVK